jgi:hypothetical protein
VFCFNCQILGYYMTVLLLLSLLMFDFWCYFHWLTGLTSFPKHFLCRLEWFNWNVILLCVLVYCLNVKFCVTLWQHYPPFSLLVFDFQCYFHWLMRLTSFPTHFLCRLDWLNWKFSPGSSPPVLSSLSGTFSWRSQCRGQSWGGGQCRDGQGQRVRTSGPIIVLCNAFSTTWQWSFAGNCILSSL